MEITSNMDKKLQEFGYPAETIAKITELYESLRKDIYNKLVDYFGELKRQGEIEELYIKRPDGYQVNLLGVDSVYSAVRDYLTESIKESFDGDISEIVDDFLDRADDAINTFGSEEVEPKKTEEVKGRERFNSLSKGDIINDPKGREYAISRVVKDNRCQTMIYADSMWMGYEEFEARGYIIPKNNRKLKG